MTQISYANFFRETPASFVNKKILKQVDLGLKHSSGIYKISNIITGDCYIGKAKDVFIRMGQHKSLLRSNNHRYRNGDLSILQKAWNKYGEDSFKFETIERCPVDELNEREQYWIAYYQCNCSKTRRGYNATDGGEGAYGNSNVKGRIQVNNGKIQKMIAPEDLEYYISIGFKRGILSSTIEKMNKNKPDMSGENHWNYGLNTPEEVKEKMRKSQKARYENEKGYWYGKSFSDEHKEKIRKAGLGRINSDETRKKISDGRKKPIVQLTKNYEYVGEFDSGTDAELATGVNRSHISQCCKKQRKTAGGFIWRFKNEYMDNL